MSFAAQRARLNVDGQLAARTPRASIGRHGDAQKSFSSQRFSFGWFWSRLLLQLKPSQTMSNLREEILKLLH